MQVKKEDRRVQRTRSMLFDALTDLMIEKGYEATTVQDVIDRANVGRSTFYSHFYDKEQLLIGNIDQLRNNLKEQIESRDLTKEKSQFGFGFSLVMLHHVRSHEPLYHATVGKRSGALVMLHMRRMLTELAQEEVGDYLSGIEALQIPDDVAVEFVVTTFLTILSWWMEQNLRCTEDECDRLFHQLVFSGISAV